MGGFPGTTRTPRGRCPWPTMRLGGCRALTGVTETPAPAWPARTASATSADSTAGRKLLSDEAATDHGRVHRPDPGLAYRAAPSDGRATGQIEAGVDIATSAIAVPSPVERTITVAVTGADQEIKRMFHKLMRASGLGCASEGQRMSVLARSVRDRVYAARHG